MTSAAPSPPDTGGAARRSGHRVAVVTLGCARNDVDSDQLAGQLAHRGVTVVEDPAEADAVLVNTCTFIEPAKRESVDTVLAAGRLKREAGVRALLVVGCMAQRYPEELSAEIPEADVIAGFDAYPDLPDIVDDLLAGRPVERVLVGPPPAGASPSGAPEPPPGRRLPLMVGTGPDGGRGARTGGHPAGRRPTPQDELDRIPASGPRFPIRRFNDCSGPPRRWAYLKIASGCDRRCTFCAIPSFRGGFRSRPLDEILAEAEFLVRRGARELVLVSENTTSYGKDLDGRHLQEKLLEELSALKDLERIRLAYLQPSELRLELLQVMAGLPKVASYFDLSLQHVSSRLLRRMARGGSPAAFRELVAHIRRLDPGAVFRSNFIVGFPGETEAEVEALQAFLEEARLDWVGLFTFSPEDGTPSATYPDQVPAEVARERQRRLADVQERVAATATAGFVGRRLRVTVEEAGEAGCTGRSYREAPEVDGEVRLAAPGGGPARLAPGRTVTAEVVAADGLDLVAVPCNA